MLKNKNDFTCKNWFFHWKATDLLDHIVYTYIRVHARTHLHICARAQHVYIHTYVYVYIYIYILVLISGMPFGAGVSLYKEQSRRGKNHTAVPHERPCGVKQIFSNSPVDELTGDSARSSCSVANCSL